MHRSLRALATGAIILACGLSVVADNGVESFRWLVGTWERESSRGTVYETWRVTSDRTLEGESYRVKKETGERVHGEAMLLTVMGPDLFYIPRPAENPYPVPFRLVTLREGTAVFENPTHDFPTRIVYERRGDDAMTVWIEGPVDGKDESRRIEFRFTRVD